MSKISADFETGINRKLLMNNLDERKKHARLQLRIRPRPKNASKFVIPPALSLASLVDIDRTRRLVDFRNKNIKR
jgi:protein-tyrosine phosphatase